MIVIFLLVIYNVMIMNILKTSALRKIVSLVAVVFIASCGGNDEKEVESIAFEKESFNLRIGEEYQLNLVFHPNDAFDTFCTWYSFIPDIASVNEKGVVKAKSLGETIIKARTGNGLLASCKIQVLPIEATSVKLSKDYVRLEVGGGESLTFSVEPQDVTFKNIDWVSENENIATFREGQITGKAVGQTRVIATVRDTKISDTCVVDIIPTPVTKIVLDYPSLNVLFGTTKSLSATVYPENATNKNVKWIIDDESVIEKNATNRECAVTGISFGTTRITAITEDGGFESGCVVNVCEIKDVIGMGLSKSISAGQDGNRWSLILNIDLPVETSVKVDRIILTDENDIFKTDITDIGYIPMNYRREFIIRQTPPGIISGDEIMYGRGWKALVVYSWNGKKYEQIVVAL